MREADFRAAWQLVLSIAHTGLDSGSHFLASSGIDDSCARLAGPGGAAASQVRVAEWLASAPALFE